MKFRDRTLKEEKSASLPEKRRKEALRFAEPEDPKL